MSVTQAMTSIIQTELKRIEQEQNIRILYACESGSRAWGFPSQDSDYDVRFIYVHPPEWYLSIFNRRDVIEYPISEQLDINGWDLRKALNLFRKSNPPLLEWLHSPIQYTENGSLAERIRNVSPTQFSPRACMYHYLHMAKGNFRGYLQGDTVKIKKYFYVLRPILACLWIDQKGTLPPVSFDELIEEMLPPGQLRSDIDQLMTRKKSGEELHVEQQIPSIQYFLSDMIDILEQQVVHMSTSEQLEDDLLDQLFRETLQYAYPNEVSLL